MTEKELKKLNRAELLELLLIQTRETELLRMKLETAKQQLADREIKISRSGSLAEAVLVVNGVIESAEKAAAQYLENARRMEVETQERCKKMLEDATAEVERILAEADQKAAKRETRKIPEEEAWKSLDTLVGEARELIGQ